MSDSPDESLSPTVCESDSADDVAMPPVDPEPVIIFPIDCISVSDDSPIVIDDSLVLDDPSACESPDPADISVFVLLG